MSGDSGMRVEGEGLWRVFGMFGGESLVRKCGAKPQTDLGW